LSNFYFAVCLDYYSIYYAREPESAHLWVAYLGFLALLLFLFEMLQLKVEKVADYFSDEANILELFGYSLCMLYSVMVLKDDVTNLNKHRDMLCYSVFFTNMRMVYHISIFYKDLRVMLMIIGSAILKLFSFIIVLYGFLMIMSLCQYVLIDDNSIDFLATLFSTYTVMFGENRDWDDIKSSAPKILLYLLSTNFVIIVCLNIVISIVTDSYEEVRTKIQSYDS